MRGVYEGQLNMYHGFKEFKAGVTHITHPLPNFIKNEQVFDRELPEILKMAEMQRMDKTGMTAIKNQLREEVVVDVDDNSRKLGVFARFTNNTLLATEVKFTQGKLRLLGDTAVRDCAQIVHDKALPHLDLLAPYGIDAESQAAFYAKIQAFNDSIGKPIAGRTNGVMINQNLDEKFKIVNEALANMDAAVEIVRLKDPKFYAAYKNARKVVNKRGTSLCVKGKVLDAATNDPIKGAKISFALIDPATGKASDITAITKTSAERGGFYIKNLAESIYLVTVKRVGYADYSANVVVAANQLTDVKVLMTKI
jgi:hypothetical protein